MVITQTCHQTRKLQVLRTVACNQLLSSRTFILSEGKNIEYQMQMCKNN